MFGGDRKGQPGDTPLTGGSGFDIVYNRVELRETSRP
jgi:hypothetical protein